MKLQVVLVLCFTIFQKIHGAAVAQATDTLNLNDVKTPSLQLDSKSSTTPFNSDADAETLQKALEASVADGTTITQILTARTTPQRLEIAAKYKDLYKKDLREEFKNKLDADFGGLLVALITPSPEYYAKELHRAMSGTGTDDGCLMEILSTLNNQELEKVRKAYQELYGVALEADIKDDTSGYFADLLTTLCNGKRDESNDVNQAAAIADAEKLYQAGERKWGTDENTFISILTQRNPEQLKQICKEYKRISGKELAYTIKCEFSGLIKQGLLTVVNVLVDSAYDYFAGRISESIGGKSKNQLTRVVSMRSAVDMEPIKSSYSANYGKSLKEAITTDNSSKDYKTCLLALLGEK